MTHLSIYSPIVITVYNRFDHLKRCIDSLRSNDLAKESVLYVISDAPSVEAHVPVIKQIREYITTLSGFKEVCPIFWNENKGGHNSVQEGIRLVLKKHKTFIFLEDDIVVSSNFLKYMNEGLEYYENYSQVFSICGYKLPFPIPQNYNRDIFFYPCNSPWGFATWRNKWNEVDHSFFDRYSELKKSKKLKDFCSIGFYIKGILQKDSSGEIQADDLRVYYHMFNKKMYSVFPVVSKTQNWGFDGSGEHCGDQSFWWAKPSLDTNKHPVTFEKEVLLNNEILENYRDFQDKINGGFWAKHLKYTWIHNLYRKSKNLIRL